MTHENIIYLLPIVIGTLLPVTFIAAYVISVLEGHVEVVFPLVSEVALYPLERCLMSQSLNIMSVGFALCVYLRHMQLKAEEAPYTPPQTLLTASLWTGISMALGMHIMANYPMTPFLIFHAFGGFLTLGVCIVFFCIQTQCTRYDPPHRFSKRFIRFRWFLSFAASFFLSLILLGAIFAHLTIDSWSSPENQIGCAWYLMSTNRRHFAGYEWYLLYTCSEWILVFIICTFTMTFARDFQYLNLRFERRYEEKLTTRV